MYNKIKEFVKDIKYIKSKKVEPKFDTEFVTNIKQMFQKELNERDDTKVDKEQNHKLFEKYHFFQQLFRISLNKPCTLIRILQIALNYGFLMVYLDLVDKDPSYNEKLVKKIKLYELEKIETYITKDVYKRFDVSNEFVEEFRKKFPIN